MHAMMVITTTKEVITIKIMVVDDNSDNIDNYRGNGDDHGSDNHNHNDN